MGQKFPDLAELHEVKKMLSERKDQWTKQWEQQAMQKGMQEGMQKGEAEILLRQMKKKFGILPSEVESRIRQASSESLLSWSDNILTAKMIEDVFI